MIGILFSVVICMVITTYINNSQSNVINKNLTQLQTFDVSLIHEFNILTPVLIFTKSNFNFNANYIYIPQYNRYYFINDITTSSGNRVQINCSIDVLKTYATQIKNAPCVVVRSESVGINQIPDEKLPIAPNQYFFEGIDLRGNYPENTGSGYVISVF